MSASSLHEAITALVTCFQGAQVEGLTVNDGPDPDPGVICLEVAHLPGDQEPVEVLRTLTDAAGLGAREVITIWSLLSVFAGTNETFSEIRGVLDTTLTAVWEQLQADLTLGGLGLAEMREIRYVPRRSEGGIEVRLAFSIVITVP